MLQICHFNVQRELPLSVQDRGHLSALAPEPTAAAVDAS
jgi:hypothetical protein